MKIGFWEIDNEEKKEFGFAHILLLILILAGMAAGVYLVQKPQIFKSKASLESISKFSVEVGEEEYVIGPTGAFLDNPFFTIQIPSGFRAFSANTNTYSFSGSVLNHLINEGLALEKGDNGYFDQCGAWLNSVYKLDENHWLGWYHGEKLTTCNYSQETVYQSMAFAESFDGGKIWSKPNYPLNQVLTGDNAFKNDEDKSSVGDAKVILFGNYLYMFYTAKTDWKMHLAKSPLEKEGRPGSWKKYYCSNANDVSSCGFTEDGLGGRSTAVTGGGSNFVSYNSYLNLFINISTWGKWGFLLKYSLPNDVTHWLNFPEMIFPLVSISDDSRVDDWVSVNRSSTEQVYGYSSIIGLDGNSDQSGKEFYLYYMKMFDGGDFNADRYLMKRKITLHNNASDPYYARVVLVRYEKTNPHKTKVSTEIAKPGTGYTKKDVLGYLLPYQADKFIPLYDCYIKEWDDYMVYSGDPSKVIAGESWRYCDSKGADFIRRIGYISQVKTNEASIPIYWCFDEQGLDHFMSTDPKCEGKKTVYLNGYLLSAPTDSSTSVTPTLIPTPTPLPITKTGFTLSTPETSYTTGEEIPVSLFAHSDTAAANLFSAKINYDSNIFKPERVDTGPAFIKNWVEQYTGEAGKVSLVGGVPNPGIQTQIGSTNLMATIYFKALKEGTTRVSFDDSSAIHSNANNTNILTSKTPVNITITRGAAPTPTRTPTPTPTPAPTPTPPVATPNPGTGDGNKDGRIDLTDLSILLSDINKTSGFRTAIDLNGDGLINSFDFSLMRNLLIQKNVIKE